MRTLLLLAAVAFVVQAALAFAAPVPRPKPKPKDTRPVEINFSPLPGLEGKVKYLLKLSVEFENGEKITEAGYKIGAKTSPDSVITLIQASFPTIDMERVGSDKLIIKGYKGNRVLNVDIKVEGIPQNCTPTQRRLPEKKEK